GKGEGLQVERNGLNDNWDDAYGTTISFCQISSLYEVIAAHGKGVFSTVVRAKDLRVGKGEPEEVAIKIIHNNDIVLKKFGRNIALKLTAVRAYAK
ncbi:hypothetical protein IFM89_036683, partial [Coptis chinensis]